MKTIIYDKIPNHFDYITIDEDGNYAQIDGQKPCYFFETVHDGCRRCAFQRYWCEDIPCEPSQRKDGKHGIFTTKPPQKQ